MTQNKFKKIFVGGLPPQTTESDMREYFSKYGEVCDVVAMRDKTGNKSRGFGFVVFKDADSVDRCQAERPHYLLGKVVDTKRAMPKEESINPDIHCNSKRIFIGGIRKFFTEDDLKNYFSNFGEIVDCTIKRDNVSGQSRGFAFITFTDRDIVDKVILSKPHTIRHCVVDVKKALSPEELRQMEENHSQNTHSDYDGDYTKFTKSTQDKDEEANAKVKEKSNKFTKRSQSYPPQSDHSNLPGYYILPTSDVTSVNSAPPYPYDQMHLIWMSVQQCPNGLILTPVGHDLYGTGYSTFYFNASMQPTPSQSQPTTHPAGYMYSPTAATVNATTTTLTNGHVIVDGHHSKSDKFVDISDLSKALPDEHQTTINNTNMNNNNSNNINHHSSNSVDDYASEETAFGSPNSESL